MEFKWILFGAVLVVNAVFAISISFFVAKKFIVPGRNALIFVLASLAIWSLGYAMITFSTSAADKKFWLRFENIGINSQPVLWLYFVLTYSRRNKFTLWPFMIALCVIPFIALSFIFSDRWFHLYYASLSLVSEHGGPLVVQRGPWYWVAFVQSYALNIISTMLLIWRFISFRDIFRRQLGFLIFAVLIPLIVNIGYQLVSNLIPKISAPIDLTPISFTLSIGLISAGIFRTRLLDLVPIARDVVMEHIPEMVFVVDAHDRVLDANTVAETWIGISRQDMIGKDPMEVFEKWPQLLHCFLFTERTREEVQISETPLQMLEVVVTPLIAEDSGKISGRVILAYNITERKLLENELKKTNKALEAKIDEVEFLKERLQEQAIRDPLTGVYNRRFLAEILEKEISKAAREQLPVSVVMMDVDHFKNFNDTYGHKCGDIVLIDLAKYLTDNSRQSDVVCRYGGEEFIILMPGASLQDAFERAEAWRQGYNSKVIEYEGKLLTTSFSAGVASFPSHGETGEAILHTADHALYQSKSNGRNRVTLYQP